MSRNAQSPKAAGDEHRQVFRSSPVDVGEGRRTMKR